jgi:hypothetical protein
MAREGLERLLRSAAARQGRNTATLERSDKMQSGKNPFRWEQGSLCLSLGAGAVIAEVAAPGLALRSVVVLSIFAGVCFTCSAHYFGKLRTSPKLWLGGIWLGVVLFGYKSLPPPNGRHLTQEQKEGLAKLRDEFPQACGTLVYVPEDSRESRDYRKEIQAGLQMHGAKANIVHEGVMPTPIGIVVGVHSSLEPCGFAGENLSVGMHLLNIPSRLAEGFPRVDASTVIVFVGTKPPYD